MSVLIKGMEMPRHCGECGIEWCDRWKQLIIAGMSIAKARPSDCPLVPVPPHGRCIDADAEMNKVKDEKGAYISQFAAVIGEAIDAAPTIIPAEEGET